MPAITVNLNVNVDASGTINVFTENFAGGITNEVVASVPLSAATLYKGGAPNSALLEFQAPNTNINDIVGSYNETYKTNATYKAALATALHAIVNGGLTASVNTIPFNAFPVDYHSYSNFGQLALGAYAAYIFGHPDATAAIDNDTTFITKMNGTGAGNADLGAALANQVFSAMNPTTVVKQVLGQDVTRALLVDNDQAGVPGIQNLEFREGDTIYMAITLKAPTLTATGTGVVPTASLFPEGTIPGAEVKYNLKITLSA